VKDDPQLISSGNCRFIVDLLATPHKDDSLSHTFSTNPCRGSEDNIRQATTS